MPTNPTGSTAKEGMRRGVVPLIVISLTAIVAVLVVVVALRSSPENSGPSSLREEEGETGSSASGAVVVLAPKVPVSADAFQETTTALKGRLSDLGVEDVQVEMIGNETIELHIPGDLALDDEQVIDVLAPAGNLGFRQVLAVYPTSESSSFGTPTEPPVLTPVDRISPDSTIVLPDSEGTTVYELGPEAISGEEILKAETEEPSGSQGTVVTLAFTPQGEASYRSLTGEVACVGMGDPRRQIAIVLDDEVLSAPQVAEDVPCNAGITGGGVITVADDGDEGFEARRLAAIIDHPGAVELDVIRIEPASER